MEQSRLKLNEISFSAAISACEKGGEWEKSLHMFAAMAHSKVEPNRITFDAAISACGRGSE